MTEAEMKTWKALENLHFQNFVEMAKSNSIFLTLGEIKPVDLPP